MAVTEASEGLAFALELMGRALKQSEAAAADMQARVIASFERIEQSLDAEAAAYEVTSPDGPEAGVMLRALDLVRAAMGQPTRQATPDHPVVEPVSAMAAPTGKG